MQHVCTTIILSSTRQKERYRTVQYIAMLAKTTYDPYQSAVVRVCQAKHWFVPCLCCRLSSEYMRHAECTLQ